MDFVFNMSRVSVIGHKRLDLPNHDVEPPPSARAQEEGYSTSWHKPKLCQVRFHSLRRVSYSKQCEPEATCKVKSCARSLLTCSGMRDAD